MWLFSIRSLAANNIDQLPGSKLHPTLYRIIKRETSGAASKKPVASMIVEYCCVAHILCHRAE